MIPDLKQSEVWFVTGSQHLYGPETLRQVEENSKKITCGLDQSPHIPCRVVFKPVVKTPDEIQQLLAEATGAPYVLHAEAGAAYAFQPAHDGERLELGNVQMEVLHTPGHTPDHLSLLVVDRTRAAEPWALLSGHTLMVGDLGRTELATDAVTGMMDILPTLVKLAGGKSRPTGSLTAATSGRCWRGWPVLNRRNGLSRVSRTRTNSAGCIACRRWRPTRRGFIRLAITGAALSGPRPRASGTCPGYGPTGTLPPSPPGGGRAAGKNPIRRDSRDFSRRRWG